MRQIGGEKDDPLKRIQEEINEVARRERELREKMQQQQHQQQEQLTPETEATTTPAASPTPSSLEVTTPVPSTDKGNLEETHSDDSGISASSSPVNGISASERKYIRPNGYTPTPALPAQKSLVRTMSTPQIFTPNRRFNFNPPQKGIMQRFIAARGKLSVGQQRRDSGSHISSLDQTRVLAFSSSMVAISPPIIERDADGRPIRRGYVPVEEKIQKELKDLKNRETELKKLRKLNSRQSQPDLLNSIEDESLASDDDSDVEHCYPPGKLRTSKSISELCDTMNSISPVRTTPSPDFDRKTQQNHQSGMRPAVSLAQLCDLDPQEAPSSHQLIAKWESLIQQNA